MSLGRIATLVLLGTLVVALAVAAVLAGSGDRGATPRALRGNGSNIHTAPPASEAAGTPPAAAGAGGRGKGAVGPAAHEKPPLEKGAAGAESGAAAGRNGTRGERRGRKPSGLERGVNAGCFAMRGGKLLVVHQRSGAWSLPGGTGEGGESWQRTAERETYEETGYHVSAGSLLTTWNGFRIYRCSVHGGSSGSKDHHEVRGYGWRSRSEILGMHWRFPKQAQHYPSWMW